jgi:tetratricopeptide (TPR) repeat protein
VSTLEFSIPEDARKEYEKARRKLGERDIEAAIEHLKKAVEQAPQFIEAWNDLGRLYYQLREYAKAEEYFREPLKYNPDYYPAMVNLAGALLSQGKLKEALPLNTTAVQMMPNDALAHSQFGLNLFYLGRLDEAEKHLKRSKELDPGHFSCPMLPLADIYFERRDFASAASELEQFLSLHPDDKQAPRIRKHLEEIRSQMK